MNQSLASHVHRQRVTLAYSCGTGQAFTGGSGTTIITLEAACGNLRYFDPVSNTLVVKSASANGYQRDIMARIAKFATFRNNCSVPCMLEVYSCVPKQDTGITPVTAYTNGLADQNNPTSTSPLMHPKDSVQLNALWSCKRVIKKTLKPGGTASCRHFSKQFQYNFALVDEHPDEYQKKYGGHFYMVRLCGILGHDNPTTININTMPARVDVKIDTHFTFSYDAGKDLHDFSISDLSEVLTAPEAWIQPLASSNTFSTL